MKIEDLANGVDKVMKTRIWENWAAKQAELMVTKPFYFIVVTGINLWFYKDKLDDVGVIFFAYFFNVLAMVIIILQKYNIVNFFKSSGNTQTAWQGIIGTLTSLVIIIGIACGLLMLFIEIIFSILAFLSWSANVRI